MTSAQQPPLACLSFDVEEFDAPLERGQQVPDDVQFETSRLGLERVLQVLRVRSAPCTLFCTVRFAQCYPDLIRSAAERHEIASHGWAHARVPVEDLRRSREELERIAGRPVIGFRMPRMAPVSKLELIRAGYRYNASEHPTWLPGRYNNFFKPRRPCFFGELLTIPASVTPVVRFPLFWLSFKNIPGPFYRAACAWSLRWDRSINLYLHPWEFADLSAFNLPAHAKRIDAERLVERFASFIEWLGTRARFATYAELDARFRERLELFRAQFG